jgi:hypothetical protein
MIILLNIEAFIYTIYRNKTELQENLKIDSASWVMLGQQNIVTSIYYPKIAN